VGINQQIVTSSHWNYFLSLEDDLIKLSRWIEFDKSNFDCFSLEMVRLLIVASSEVDVVAKMLCKEISGNNRARSISPYQYTIIDEYEGVSSARIQMPRYGLTLTPWDEWKTPNSPPIWWQENNKVKHHRSEHYSKATLKNVLNAIAGLLVLLLYYYGRVEHGITTAPRIMESINITGSDGDFLMFTNW